MTGEAPIPPTLADLLALCSEHGRVCPQPAQWARLYELLPDTRHDAYGAIPAEPLMGNAWSRSTDAQKIERLREHLDWAQAHGALAAVHSYLSALAESQWYHVDDLQ